CDVRQGKGGRGRRPGCPPAKSRHLEDDADGAGAGVSTNHCTEVADDDLLARVEGFEHPEELVEVGGVAVQDGKVLEAGMAADLVDEVAQGPRPSPLLGLCLDGSAA